MLKLKVLIISSVYPRFHEDKEVPWLRESVHRLKASGVDVNLLVPSYNKLKSHYIDNVPVYRFRYAPKRWEHLTHDEGAPNKLDKHPLFFLLAIPYILSGFFWCLYLTKRKNYDLIHVHWPFPHGLIALSAKWFCQKPIILHFYGASLLLVHQYPFVRPVLKFLLMQRLTVVAISRFVASKIKAIRQVPVQVIPYGAAVKPRLLIKHKSSSPFRVLFVGRHIERKGIIYLIRAIEKLGAGSEIECRIVGTGHITECLKQAAAKTRNTRIVFTGQLSNESLLSEYANANVFVLPAIVDSRGDTEGLGVVLLEAINFSLPIIATNVGGIPDVVLHDETGLLVPEKDVNELACAILRVKDNPALVETVTSNAINHASRFFAWDSIIHRLITVYQYAVNSRFSKVHFE